MALRHNGGRRRGHQGAADTNDSAVWMGKQNRQRRAAKQRARRAEERRRPQGNGHAGDFRRQYSSAELIDAAAEAIFLAARDRAHGARDAPRQCADALLGDLATERVGLLEAAADRAATSVLGRLFEQGGWLPEDVHQYAVRNLGAEQSAYLVDVIVLHAEPFPTQRIHPRWRAQLHQMDARRWWAHDRPHLPQWAERNGLSRAQALEAVIDTLAQLIMLPKLPRILPLPGEATHREESVTGVDEKVLARVRGLLAKAESTSFAEEAEALSAKAQELMSRHSIERALVDAETKPRLAASARRIWLDNPYVGPKSLLVAAVAKPNRCRTVSYQELGFVTVLGDEVDLDIVEVLTTSLLVQANRAMLAEGRQVNQAGQSKTRSYRQSFLVAYASRIGERLDASAESAMSTVDESVGPVRTTETTDRLLPVLAARERAVDALFESLFPRLTERRISVSNAAGWHAGRAAADLAVLGAHKQVSK